MDLSVVIVSYKNPDLLRKSLSSLRRNSQSLDPEIIVVDNDSGDGSADVARSYAGVTVEETGSNLGFAGGVNRGLALARGRYILILNPDIDVHPGALESLVDFMDAHPQTGLAGPKLLNTDGTLQHSCRRFYTLKTILLRRTPLGKLFPRSRSLREHLMLDYDHQKPRAVDWVAGAAMIVRREAVLDVGPMDDRYFLYFEDVDWCRRMHARGWEVQYVPQSEMTHAWQRASSGFSSTTGIHIRSGLKFYERWGVFTYLLRLYQRPLRVAGLVLVDAAAMVLAFLVAYAGRQQLAFWLEKPVWPLSFYVSFLTTSLAVFLLTFASCGLYRQRRQGDWVDVAFDVAKGSTLAFLIVMASTYMLDMRGFSRVLVLGSWPIVMVLTFLNRRAIVAGVERVQKERFNLERLAVLGDDPALSALAARLQEPPNSPYELVHMPLKEPQALIRSLTQERVVGVMLSSRSFDGPGPLQDTVQTLRRAGFQVHVAEAFLEALPRHVVLERSRGVSWLTVVKPGLRPGGMAKRLMDIVLGVTLSVVCFLPALFRGFGGRFDWYRRLGQVIVGRMSLVGPRPAATIRANDRPGVTGLWSIRPCATPQDEAQQELEYLEERSVETDLKILVRAFLKRFFLVAVCLSAFQAGNLRAQGFEEGLTPFLNAYDMKELVQSADGTLWIASNGGALHYRPASGTWDAFPRLRFSGPAGNDCVTVAAGEDGLVWFGSETRGVSSYDPALDRWTYFEEVPDDGTGRIETSVIRTFGDQLFIGTLGGLSLRFAPNRVDVCNEVNDACAVPSYVIQGFAKTGDSLWVATQKGLALHDGGTWVPLDDLPRATQEVDVTSVATFESTLWLIVDGNVVTLRDTTLVPSGASGERLKVSSGELLLLHGLTVARWDNDAWTDLFQVTLPSRAQVIRDVEKVGEAYYITTDQGLVRQSGSAAGQSAYPPGPPVAGFHNGLTVDDAGTVWVVNREGLLRYRDESWTFMRRGTVGLDSQWGFDIVTAGNDVVVGHCCCDAPPACRLDVGDGARFDSLGVYDAWALAYDGKWIWAGTNDEGAYLVTRDSGGQWRTGPHFTTSNSPLLSNPVTTVAADADEAWFGHQNAGVTYWHHSGNLSGGEWGRLTAPADLLDNSVNALLAEGGGVWIGTSTGIHRVFGDLLLESRRTVLPDVAGDRPRPVRAIVVDKLGNLWLGTDDGILVRKTNQFEFELVTAENSSLPSNTILSGALDPVDGSVWFGCTEGIVRIDPVLALGINPSHRTYTLVPNPYDPADMPGTVSFMELSSGAPAVPSFDSGTPIDVLDVSGKVVGNFVFTDGWTWDGRNTNGLYVAPGLYIVRARPAGAEAVLLKLGVIR